MRLGGCDRGHGVLETAARGVLGVRGAETTERPCLGILHIYASSAAQPTRQKQAWKRSSVREKEAHPVTEKYNLWVRLTMHFGSSSQRLAQRCQVPLYGKSTFKSSPGRS